MSSRTSRRQFLQAAAAATTAGYWVAGGVKAQESNSPNERIRFACIGVGGKGSSDSIDAGRHGDVVAICDVDSDTLDKAATRFDKAKKFFDYREMLESMANNFDAVTVSTPDHNHAPASLMAMRLGKHCFCQKPMTHSIAEARMMAQVAAEKKVATQMGNQGTAGTGLRKAAAMIKAGALGTIKEVHVWTNRPIWAQGDARPAAKEVPANLKWDLWLGPAKEREYGEGYHPFAWRGFWDFGTGALGDMACHTMNLAFMALDLRDPISVQAMTSGHNKDSYPKRSQIVYEFAARGDRPALNMIWYDGGNLPSSEILNNIEPADSGLMIIGEKGKLYSPNDYGERYRFLGEIQEPDVEYVRSTGHFTDWADAIKGGKPAMSNFPDYAGPLTETVLLGNLAVWADGQKVAWDAKNMKAGSSEFDHIIKPEYRKGYTL
jgi:predicted dehydrogenase